MQPAFQKHWHSFLNRAVSGWCFPSVRTVELQLHTISIIRTGVQTVLPWRPDGCNSSPCLALSRIESRRCRLVVRTVATVFPYLCLEGNPLTCRILNSIRMCCWDVRTDTTLNSSNLLDIDGSPDRYCLIDERPDSWQRRPDGILRSDISNLESVQNLLGSQLDYMDFTFISLPLAIVRIDCTIVRVIEPQRLLVVLRNRISKGTYLT